MHIYALISHNDTKDATDFVRDPKTGKVVFVEATHAPDKDVRGFWTECVRTDDSTVHRPDSPAVKRAAEPVFSFAGGRVVATFALMRK